MTKDKILEFINKISICFMATTEGDTPHVRGMRAHKADYDGIIFYTAKDKALYRQLMQNPKAEVCFYDFQNVIQVRASGKMELVEDIELKKEIGSIRPNAKARVDKEGSHDWMAVYQLKNVKLSSWSLKPSGMQNIIIDL